MPDSGWTGTLAPQCLDALGLPGPPQLTEVYRPVAMAVGDLDGDARPDVVVAGYLSLWAYFNLGQGTRFEGPYNLDSQGDVSSVAIADVDRDGRPDIVFAEQTSISWVRNAGGRLFSEKRSRLVSAIPTLAVQDFSGDGLPDVVAGAASEDLVRVLMNRDGAFDEPAAYATLGRPLSIALGDFDHDGRTDFAVSGGSFFGSQSGVRVYSNTGNGQFGKPLDVARGTGNYTVLASELTQDSATDLVVLDPVDSAARILKNDGSGAFVEVARYPIDTSTKGASLADLNGDSKPDLVVWTSTSALLRFGNGDGSFGEVRSHDAGTELNVLADATGDGVIDVVALSAGTLQVLENARDGTFPPPRNRRSHPTVASPHQVLAADLDGNRSPDLVVVGADGMSIAFNRGNGTFIDAQAQEVGPSPRTATALDVNGDARLDLVSCSEAGLRVHVNLGGGRFEALPDIGATLSPTNVVAGDLNGDGSEDLVTANFDPGGLAVLIARGDGAFEAPARYGVGDGPLCLALDDFDGDGDVDIASARPEDRTVTILKNDGGGRFAAAGAYALGAEPTFLSAGDLDRDGRPDLVVAGPGGARMLPNQGEGTFEGGIDVEFGHDAYGSSIALADTDRDGSLDIVVAAMANLMGRSNLVAVFRNAGSWNFDGPFEYPTGQGPASIVARDVNDDGTTDVVVANRDDDDVSILLNQCIR